MDAPQLVQVNLEEFMRMRKMSQSELSRRSGVRQATISEILHGHTSPTLQVLQKLANALSVRPAAFFIEPVQKSA